MAIDLEDYEQGARFDGDFSDALEAVQLRLARIDPVGLHRRQRRIDPRFFRSGRSRRRRPRRRSASSGASCRARARSRCSIAAGRPRPR